MMWLCSSTVVGGPHGHGVVLVGVGWKGSNIYRVSGPSHTADMMPYDRNTVRSRCGTIMGLLSCEAIVRCGEMDSLADGRQRSRRI